MSASGDLLLRWMSEVGSGSIRSLRSHLCWASREAGVSEHETQKLAGRWIRDQITVGHLNVDWDARQGTWRVAQPLLTTLPGGYGYALVTGGRPHRVDEALARDELVAHKVRRSIAVGDIEPPTAVFVSYQTSDDLSCIAAELGVRFVSDAAVRLAERLERIKPGVPCAPPVSNGGLVQQWNTRSSRFDVAHKNREWKPGLYRQEVFGRSRHMLHTHGTWCRTTYSEGIYLVASDVAGLIRWRRDPASREDIGTVFVDRGMSLPDPQRRVLGLCTGLGPKIGKHSNNTRYENVPRSVAVLVASSLRQRLSILPTTE